MKNLNEMLQKTIVGSIVILVFVFVSCDLLDSTDTPLDEISTDDYWYTTNDLRLFVNQFYPAAFLVSGSDRYEFIFAADLHSDDIVDVQISSRLRGIRTVPESGGMNYRCILSNGK